MISIKGFLSLLFFLFFSEILFAQSTYSWYNPAFIGGICVKDPVDIFHRLPSNLKNNISQSVWNLSLNTAGEYIDFTSNAQDIVVKYEVTGSLALPHMPATGVSGLALWAKDHNGIWNWAPGAYHFGDTITYSFKHMVFSKGDAAYFRLYLPLYNTVKWLSIGCETSKNFSFINNSHTKPIIVYGTSIVQGGVASRPDLAWTNILQRRLDKDVINLGFSGNGKMEAPLIDLMASVSAELYIIDCMANLIKPYGISDNEIEKRINYAINKLRDKNKNVPILLVENSGGYATGYLDTLQSKQYKQSSELLATILKNLKKSSVKNIYLLTDKEIGFDVNSTTDGIHPNDIGMMKYAKAYENKIRWILHKSNKSTNVISPNNKVVGK